MSNQRRTKEHCQGCSGSEHDYHELASGQALQLSGRWVHSQWIGTPAELELIYERMLDAVQPRRRPRLACRDRSGGGGGRWFAHGVIVLGLSELAELARKIWQSLASAAGWQGNFPAFADVEHAVRVLVLAHELGHELKWAGYRSPHDSHAEAAADYWAGWLVGHLGLVSSEFGAIVFAAIGCNYSGCSHPSSSTRSKAFQAGYADAQAGARPTRYADFTASPSSGAGDVLAVGLLAVGIIGGIAALAALAGGGGRRS